MKSLLAHALLCSAATGRATQLKVPLDSPTLEEALNITEITSDNVINLAKEMISDTGTSTSPSSKDKNPFKFPTLTELTETHGGTRLSPGMIEHLKAMEEVNFGARKVCPEGGKGHIYFLDPYPTDGEMYLYHLQTQWWITYPGLLRDKLRGQGFRVLEKKKGMPCDIWDPVYEVTRAGVKRGSLELNWWCVFGWG